MGEGALPFAFCQTSRTTARSARMPMPCHDGAGASAAVEMSSAQAHREGSGEDKGHDAGPDAGEKGFDPGVLE